MKNNMEFTVNTITQSQLQLVCKLLCDVSKPTMSVQSCSDPSPSLYMSDVANMITIAA